MKNKGKAISGQAVEKLAKKWLEKQYPDAFIEGPPIRTKWCRQDYFGLFDFLVVFSNKKRHLVFEIETTWIEMMGVQVSKKYLSSKSKEFKKAWREWPGSKLYLHYRKGEFQLK